MRSYTRRTFGIAAALFLASCFGDSTGIGARRRVPLSIAPVFDSRAALSVPFDKVRIRLVRPGTSELVMDTVVDFPSSADSVVLALSVPVQGSSETFLLGLTLFQSAGDTVFRGGPVTVDVLPGVLNAAPANIPMVYVGPGWNAAGVLFATLPPPVFFADTAAIGAVAYDSTEQPIPGTPIIYHVDARDSALAYVPNPDVGRVVARSTRGSARIVATLLTHQADTATLLIQPRPSAIALVSGGGQSAAIGGTLSQPIMVHVTGADGLAIVGVPVTFAATAGGGSFSPNPATTDSSGDASTSWTLGSLVGTQTMTATAGTVTSSAISATGGPASASKLGFTVQPVTTAAGALMPAVSVAAQDAFGNLYSGFAGNVTLALGSNPGGATLSGTTTVSTVAGLATFGNLSLDKSGTGYTLVASTSGLTSATSAGFNITGGAAKTLSLVSGGNQSGPISTVLQLPIVVKVADSIGNGVSGRAVTFAVATGGGSLGTPSATTDGQGLASTTWTLGPTTGSQTITATSTGLAGSPLTVTATASGAVASTTVTPKVDTLTALTATFQLTATAKDAAGATVNGTFTWVSRATGVATVSTAGLVTAVANGSTWVVATESGGTKDSAQIVVQQRVASVNVTPAAPRMYWTTSRRFTAAAVDGLGKPMPGVTAFSWASTAPAVASVDTSGLVYAAGLGTAQIRATTSGITGVSNVTVISTITRIAVVVDTVGASKTDTFSMASLGLTRRYRGIAHDTLDAVMSGISFAWVSTNGSVAVMNTTSGDTASATSAANGYTQIRATAQQVTSTPGASLTVSQVLAAIALTPPSPQIAVTGTVGLVARGLDANGRYISGGTFIYHSATPSVATVDSISGRVTGVALGTANITATSGSITSNIAVVTVSATVPAVISFGRDTLSVGRGGSASIPILLSQPVPVGTAGLTVNLAVRDTFAYWSTTSVTIPVGQSSINATLNGRNAGTTLVTATDGSGLGYASGSATVAVTANMHLASGSYAINATDIASTQVILSDPSPAGGTYVAFAYGTAGIAAISPDPAFIPAGQLAADIQIRGLAAGTTTITPNAIGVNGTASTFTAYAPVLTLSTSAITLGLGQYEPNDYVYTPTNTNLALPVTFGSSDTSVVATPPAVTIPAQSYYAYFSVATRGLGTATVTATATGWTAAGSIRVTSTSPAVGICCGTTLYTTSPQTNVTVYAEDSLRSAHYRINSLLVRLRSTDTTVLKVVDTTVTIAAGQYYNSGGRIVPGGLGGTAYIVATASGHAPDSTQYTVLGAPLSLNWTTSRIGAGQQDQSQYVYTPNNVTTPLVVTLKSSDTTRVGVPATATIPAGTYYSYFTILGKVPGSAIVTASAAGYQADSGSYVVTSPSLVACCNATVNAFGPGGGITVYAADSARGTHYRTTPLAVSVVSTDTTVVKVDSSVVTILAGQYYNNLARFTPVNVGTARIIFSAGGHTSLDTLTITVNQPKLNISFNSYSLGRRQHQGASDFYVYTPDNRTTALAVTLTQKHATVDSLSSTSVTVPVNSYYAYFNIYGLAQGLDTVIATAAGYIPDTAFVTVTTPRFTDSGLPGSTTTTNPPFNINVYAADSVGTVHYVSDTVVVHAVSTDSNVIRPAQPYFRILKNAYYATPTMNVMGPGTARVIFSDSAGTGYRPDTTNAVTVTGPVLALANGSSVLGMRQHGGPNSSYVYTPNNVTDTLVVSLVSTDPRVATVPATLKIPPGSYYAYFDVTAQDTVGTIQIQATATGYGAANMNVQVTQPKFLVGSTSTLYTTSSPASITIYATDSVTGNAHYVNDSVKVNLFSTASSVAAIDSASVWIPVNSYYVTSAHWSPGIVGTSTLEASDQRSVQYKYGTGTEQVTVIDPSLSFSWGTENLGIGQYIDEYVYTPDNPTTAVPVSFSHSGTARISTLVGGVAVSGVTIPAGTYLAYFRIVGTSAGSDSLIGTATSPLHVPDTAFTVVGSGTLGTLGSWPTVSLKVGDSTVVRVYALDPTGNSTRYVAAATTVTLRPQGKVQFVSGGANSVPITSIDIPADAYYVQFYIKGVSAGTDTPAFSATNYVTYNAPTVTVTP